MTYVVTNQEGQYLSGTDQNGDPLWSDDPLDAKQLTAFEASLVIKTGSYRGQVWSMVKV